MEKNVPFVFGMVAGALEFTNRTQETKHLIRNFEGGINTILISPRRWGKSSLVAHAALQLQKKNKKIKVCMLDLFGARNEEEFYSQYAQAVINTCSRKIDEALEISRKFLGQFIPKLSITPDPNSEIAVGLDWKEVKKSPEDILNLAEAIAKSRGIRIVVCMDEFQNIATFENPLGFQKKLRAAMQRHKHVTYCFYGSKRHMLMDVFTKPSMPFYKFGDIVFLEKLSTKDLCDFIQKRFQQTGKNIAANDAAEITRLTECHPYYTQQLAQQVWLQTARKTHTQIVFDSHERMCDQFSMFFQALTDSLSATQVNFLRALVNQESNFYRKDIIETYRLGTSANVSKIKKALEDREIIDLMGPRISILDPYYAYWLKTRYFR